MSEIAFVAFGKPIPQGSKKAFVNKGARFAKIVDVNHDGLMSWRSVVADAARRAWIDAGDGLIDTGICLDVTFFLARPRSHFGTGKNAAKLKPSAPEFPIWKPDWDKMVRALCDALTNVIWTDDARVHEGHVRKRYGIPSAEVRITYTKENET